MTSATNTDPLMGGKATKDMDGCRGVLLANLPCMCRGGTTNLSVLMLAKVLPDFVLLI